MSTSRMSVDEFRRTLLPVMRKSRTRKPEPPPVEIMADQLDRARIAYVREYKFHRKRRWRADFFIAPRLILEIEGGSWLRSGGTWSVNSGGRHTRGQGFENDIIKYNEALMLGLLVLRVTPRQITNGKALAWVQRMLAGGKKEEGLYE